MAFNEDSRVKIPAILHLVRLGYSYIPRSEQQRIIYTMNLKQAQEDFSVVVKAEEVIAKNYSLSAGQYFEVKIEYTDITAEEFEAKMNGFKSNLDKLFTESKTLEKKIQKQLSGLKYE